MAHAQATELDSENAGGGGSGSAAASDVVTIGAAGDVTDWTLTKQPGTNNRLLLKKGNSVMAVFDPTAQKAIQLCPTGSTAGRSVSIETWNALNGVVAGVMMSGAALGENERLILIAGDDFAAGKGVTIQAYDAGAGLARQGLTYDNSAGFPVLKLQANGGTISVFGATGTGQATFGAATAGGVYTAAEATMLQKCYDLLRGVGFGT